MTSSSPVGIDLGSTRCALTRLDPTGRSAMIRNVRGDLLIPSVVFFEDDELLFGRDASQAAITQPGRAAEFVKRDFGQPAYSRAIGGELLPVEVIEACLLKNLCAELPAMLRAKPAIVLAVPAAFDQAQRRGMNDAARMAGLDVLGTISDPLATALAFAESQGYLTHDPGDKPGCRVLVFDLGGGKLDVAIIEIKPGKLRTLAVGGDDHLGGRDWDARLADFLAEKFAKQFGEDPRYDMVSVRRLLTSAEETKHTLTARQQARVRVERQSKAADVVVDRGAFEDASAELIERAKQVTERVLGRAGMAWRDLAHLLLVGGATRMPMVANQVESMTGLKATSSVHTDEAVARGAVLYAEHLLARRESRNPAVRLEIIDMTAHSLGIEWQEPGKETPENVVLIPRGTELPSGTSSKISTEVDNQAAIAVQLLEGEEREAYQCRRIARINVSGLPEELPRGSQIEVFFQITGEGRLQVKAQMARSGRALAIEVDRAGGLTEREVADWSRVLQSEVGLKAIHAHLARQASRAASAPPPVPTRAVGAVPQESPVPLAASLSDDEAFELDVATDPSGERLKKNRTTPKKIVVLLTGYVVSAILGLAIGYYILLMLRPELNVLQLRLPGIRPAAPRGEAFPTRIERSALGFAPRRPPASLATAAPLMCDGSVMDI
jgi:molecular chaperone DnaK